MMLVSSVSIELKQILRRACLAARLQKSKRFFLRVSAQMQALLSFFFSFLSFFSWVGAKRETRS